LYLQLGNPAAITQARHQPQVSAQGSDQAPGSGNQIPNAANAPSLDKLLPQLEERLAESPEDVDGWRLLGRSYLSVSNFEGAKKALLKALALDDSDVPTLAQLAEATAMTQDGSLAGKPMEYLKRANTLDPGNEHTLWLLAIAQQQAGNHDAALEGFNQLLALAGDDLQASSTIEQMRRRSMEALALDNSSENQLSDNEQDNATAQASISVSVSLSAEALRLSQPDQTVFVYATATDGPPMPLAVQRLTVSDLPTTVLLDDSMAMIPTMTLSSFPQVTVGARVSTTGTPTAQEGEWFNERENIELANTDTLQLILDKQVSN